MLPFEVLIVAKMPVFIYSVLGGKGSNQNIVKAVCN